MSAPAPPTVIEAAVNGMVTKAQNPHVPRTVDETGCCSACRRRPAGWPPRLARNEELVAEIAALCRAAGRPPATVEEAPKILFS